MSKKILLSGKVQGVGCRNYCIQYARTFGIKGAVSNLSNGKVELILKTDDHDAIVKYINALHYNSNNYFFLGNIEDIKVYDYSGQIRGDFNF